jgi:flavin reductase (DIM6/NTAB) family NADH-FMN oxidoreductase RutF
MTQIGIGQIRIGMTLIDKNEFRSALSEFATGVTVITTLDDDGEPHTMTANAFTSVCLDPPIILVSIAHGTHTFGYVENRQSFGVNFLNQDQQELGAYFAKKPEDRTGDVKYSFSKSNEGLPVLDGSIVFFECDVVGSHVYGDHTIFLAEVTEIRRNESDAPLMFYKSRWYNPAKD